MGIAGGGRRKIREIPIVRSAEKIRQDCGCFLLIQQEVGHSCFGSVRLRVVDPIERPFGAELCAKAPEIGADFIEMVETFNVMAAIAAKLDDGFLPAIEEIGAFEIECLLMTLPAPSVYLMVTAPAISTHSGGAQNVHAVTFLAGLPR